MEKTKNTLPPNKAIKVKKEDNGLVTISRFWKDKHGHTGHSEFGMFSEDEAIEVSRQIDNKVLKFRRII